MTTLAINEFSLATASADDPDYVATIDIRNAIMAHVLGDAASPATPNELLPYLQDDAHNHKRLYLARVDGEVVGSALMVWPNDPESRITGIDLGVATAWRNQGIGTALYAQVESDIRAAGRPVVQVGAVHEAVDGEMLAAPTGYGAVPLADPGVRFLQKNDFQLEQVYRVSILPLPVPEATLVEYEAQAWAKAADDYRLHHWVGSTPEQWQNDIATLNARMSTDAPSGNLEVEQEPWDAERVRKSDERRVRAGRVSLVSAVEHVPTGTLVAFNGVSLSAADRTRPVQQGITLVLKEHRGHKLGMLVKVANIRQIMIECPEAPFIITDNAEENRPMLDVNEAVGFVPVAYEGAWQKTLT